MRCREVRVMKKLLFTLSVRIMKMLPELGDSAPNGGGGGLETCGGGT